VIPLSPGRRTAVPGVVLLLASLVVSSVAAAGPVYTSPCDGATYVLRESNIVVRSALPVSEQALHDANAVIVTGSVSGVATGRLRLAGDRRTIFFEPDRPFEPDERVVCRVGPGVVSGPDGAAEEFWFAFTTAGPRRDALRAWRAPTEIEAMLPADRDDAEPSRKTRRRRPRRPLGDDERRANRRVLDAIVRA
jgi:hypothetical protein